MIARTSVREQARRALEIPEVARVAVACDRIAAFVKEALPSRWRARLDSAEYGAFIERLEADSRWTVAAPGVVVAMRCCEALARMAQWVLRLLDGGQGASWWRRLPLFLCVLGVGVAAMLESQGAVAQLPPPLPVNSGGGYLHFILSDLDGTTLRWMVTAKRYALWLFGALLSIQLVTVCGRKASEEGFFAGMYSLIDTAMRKGVWGYFLANVEQAAPGIWSGLAQIGEVIAGSNLSTQPSMLVDIAKVSFVNLVKGAWEGSSLLTAGPTLIIVLILSGIIFLVFLFCGLAMALTLVTLKIAAVGSLVLVGCAGLDATSRYAWQYVDLLVRGGMKLLALALVMGLAASFTEQWRLQVNSISGVTDILALAFDLVGGGFFLLFMILLIPFVTSAVVTGHIGDAGEGKVSGAAAALSQSVAMGATAWALGGAMQSAVGATVPVPSNVEGPEQRAQRLIQAASGQGSGGGGSGGGSSGRPARPGAGGGGAAGAARAPAVSQQQPAQRESAATTPSAGKGASEEETDDAE